MIKILTGEEIQKVDRFTVEKEPISSADLMERAALTIFAWLKPQLSMHKKVHIFAGPGNNGGDAVALYRIMVDAGINAVLTLVNDKDFFSPDCEKNIQRLNEKKYPYLRCQNLNDFPFIENNCLLIDGIFGSGINKPVVGFYSEIIRRINELTNYKISIDLPSGLYDKEPTPENGAIIKANLTLTLQFPKLSFFMPENNIYIGNWHILDIGLHEEGIKKAKSNFYLTEKSDIAKIHRKRARFDHKNTFGHSLIIAGNNGKHGAMILASKACMRSGSGLLSVLTDNHGEMALNCVLPESMVFEPRNLHAKNAFEKFNAIGIGPGLNVCVDSQKLVFKVLSEFRKPLVIDADAINILSKNNEWLQLIPTQSILTPHLGEFDRLCGKSTNGFERLHKAQEFARKYNVVLILKGANSAVINMNGEVYFNTTGNPGMATAGSGDVLTGIITGLLSTGYSSFDAAKLGVWIHGCAGDLALETQSEESLIASDIIENLGKAFRSINS